MKDLNKKFYLKVCEEKDINFDFPNINQNILLLISINNRKCNNCCTSCCCNRKMFVKEIQLPQFFTVYISNLFTKEKCKKHFYSNIDFKMFELPKGEYEILLKENCLELFKFRIAFKKSELVKIIIEI